MITIQERCISILAHLWGAGKSEKAIGTSTTGSSEAIHLGGLAMKRRWQEARRTKGLDTSRPNIIMGANAQVALEKFARYFDVEARILPVSEESKFRLDPKLVEKNLDENTIGVFVIMGSTYTGHFEPVEEISKVLDAFQERTGIDIPIHVDAASGGFVAPFTKAKAGGPKWYEFTPYDWQISVYILTRYLGTSNCPVSSLLTPRATSTAWYTQVSDGLFGATSHICPST